MGPTPLSSTSNTNPILSYYPQHLGLIPSNVGESTPIVPDARPMTVFVATAMAMPTTAKEPIFVPNLPSPKDW